MKNLIYIAAIFWLMSCSKDDPGPKYKDLSGTWTFSGDGIHGQFVTKLDISGQYVKVESGTFTINDMDFAVDDNTSIHHYSDLSIDEITVNDTGHGFISFTGATYKSDFSEMKATSYMTGFSDPNPPYETILDEKSVSVTFNRVE